MGDNLIVICVPTYKRNTLLRACLSAIGGLECPCNYKIEMLVVDNDDNESAKSLSSEMAASFACPLHYFVHPERGLSSVRNRLLEEAIKLRADIIAFIDDDEQPDKAWLVQHMENMTKYGADVCSGPVRPIGAKQYVPEKKEKITGSTPRYVSTNNVVFKSSLATTQGLCFDPFFNFIGGEDFDFFERSKKQNNVHIWVEEALVLETIPVERNNLRYLFYRHFTGGINNVMRFKRTKPAWRVWGRFMPKFAGKLVVAVFYCVFSCIRLNRVLFASAVKKFASGLGYLAGLLNIVVERYRNIDSEDVCKMRHPR